MPGFPNNPKKRLLLHDGAHPGIQVSIGIGVTQQQKKKDYCASSRQLSELSFAHNQ